MSDIIQTIKQAYRAKFGEEPLVIRSPGRINLIGEHTDYNEGFVLPAAIDKAIYLAIGKRQDRKTETHALDMEQHFSFDLDLLKASDLGWPNYLMGVVEELQARKHSFNGFNLVFSGDIPVGSGLSSSAALEVGLVEGLSQLYGLDIPGVEQAKIGQLAENNFVGVRCGIMDQFANRMGKAGHVIRLDCRSLDYSYFPFDFPEIAVVLADTQVKHSLADSAYNKRREECETAADYFNKNLDKEVKALRDVSPEEVEAHKEQLGSEVYKRAKYVTEEEARLLAACEALEKGDLKTFGQKMYATHEGLSKAYEVSCAELDFLVEQAKKLPFVYGSRMMGGGFGGCTINLVEKDKVDDFVDTLRKAYQNDLNKEAKFYITQIGAGTGPVEA